MEKAEADMLLAMYDSVDTWNRFLGGVQTEQHLLAAQALTALHDLLRPLLVVLLERSTVGV
jgi:hypothetical protein